MRIPAGAYAPNCRRWVYLKRPIASILPTKMSQYRMRAALGIRRVTEPVRRVQNHLVEFLRTLAPLLAA